LNTDQQMSINAWNLTGVSPDNLAATRSGGPSVTCPLRTTKYSICYS
jgi:hypothetical protein